MKKRILAALLTLCLLAGLLPTVALAADATTPDLSNSDITIKADGSYTVSNVETEHTITIKSGVTCDLTISDLKITATNAPAIRVEAGAMLNLTVEGENTLTGGPGYAGICVEPGYGGPDFAWDSALCAKLTISGSGKLTATGGTGDSVDGRFGGGAGIGGNSTLWDGTGVRPANGGTSSFGTVTIIGGEITAVGGTVVESQHSTNVNNGGGAGIGTGGNSFHKALSNSIDFPAGVIEISGGKVTAVGGNSQLASETGGGAGIGTGGVSGGHNFPYNNSVEVTISNGDITAIGKADGAGIGGGSNVNGGVISITGGTVEATGGYEREGKIYGGAGIGGGDMSGFTAICITGGTVEATAVGAAAGIGGGKEGYVGTLDYYGAYLVAGSIVIGGNAKVTATGGSGTKSSGQEVGGSGIGSGYQAEVYGTISICGQAEVQATGKAGAAGIGGGFDGGFFQGESKSSLTIEDQARVTAVGGTANNIFEPNTPLGGAGIGSGVSFDYDNGCNSFTLADTATVLAYAGKNAQAIGVGANYGANEGKDVNTLTIADTVTLWAQNQDIALPALLDKTIPGTNTLKYTSTGNYLVSNKDAVSAAVGYLTLPGGTETAMAYSLAGDTLTIDGTEITAAKPVGTVGNWATIKSLSKFTVDYYVDGQIHKTEEVQGGDQAVEPTPAPEKDGFVFAGWCTDENTTQPYDFQTPVTGNLNLYAKFIEVKVDVKINVKVDIKVHISGFGEDHAIVKIDDNQKPVLAKNIDFKTDVNKDTTKIEIDAIVANASDKNEQDRITEYLAKNQYNCGNNRIDYDIIVKKLIYTNEILDVSQELHELKYPIEITFAIPDEWQRGGTVSMFCAHIADGTIEVTKLPDLDTDAVTYTIKSDKFSTYTMVYVPTPGGSGGEVTTYYTLHYESNGGTEYKDERYAEDTVVKLDKVPVREGYQFTGWYADKELTQPITSIKMIKNQTVYAGWQAATVPGMLNGDDHFAYVVGYPDGTVQPDANISRAEVAEIFFRLLKAEIRDENLIDTNPFADVEEGMWFNKSVSTMAELGIVKGRTTGNFDPNAPITRAEFAAICARFDTGVTNGDSEFTDISGHWAEAEIECAASLGWIMGYPDGTFRPDSSITRAEAMSIINRVLCRIPENEDDLLPGMNVWPDNQPGTWYYLAVQEATNSHDFQYKGEIYEHWTELTADPDWTRYQ